MKKWDVAVAGAGVAGCVAAKRLAEKGHSVLLVEKRCRQEMGHDWWDTIEAGICEKVGLAEPKPPELMSGFNFRIFTPLGDTGTRAEMSDSECNVDRRLFGERVIEAAERAGARFMFDTVVAGPLFDGGKVAGLKIQTGDGGEEYVEARITIDASGAGGVLRSKMPEKYGFPRRFRGGDCVATWREIREDTSRGGRTILVLGKYNGVQWVSRDNAGLVDVFACVPNIAGAANPKDICAELVRDEGGMGREILRAGHAARIPVRRSFDSFVAPGLMLVGDCASMANPLNGSGVSSAMDAAAYAAGTAHDALLANSFGIADLWDYNVKYKRERDIRFAQLYILQQTMFSESAENIHALLSRVVSDPEMFWKMEHMLNAAGGIKILPKLLKIADRPAYLARITFAFVLAGMVDRHYQHYPRRYSVREFNKWRRRAEWIFNLVPRPVYYK